MYQQEKYLKQDPEYLLEFIEKNPFATFILKANHLLATHIPVLPEGTAGNFRLFGHIAHNNEQYEYLRDDLEVLLVFQGAHGYISSSWYKNKGISTWNYSAVHVNAKIKLQSVDELEASLEQLVQRFEKDQKNPFYYRDIPKDMLKEHLPLIKGFWCEPYKIQGIVKMSQGHEEDIPQILEHLEHEKDCSLRAEIKNQHSEKSSSSDNNS